MDKQRLDKALTRLGQLLRERRVAGEIAVFGGAAIVLGFDFLDEQVLPENGGRFGVSRGKSMRPTSLKEAVDRIIGGESWVDAD